MEIIQFFTILIICLTIMQAESTLLDQLNFFVNQNRYTMQSSSFQSEFSPDAVISQSLDLAVQNCQKDFQWERWNCPNSDFFRRHHSSKQRHHPIDREDSYVTAIVAAATLYTITKDCSMTCSDDVEKAAMLYKEHIQQKANGKDFHGLMAQHNFNAIKTLVAKSLIRQCGCSNNACSTKNCVDVLRPFNEIARDIKNMYDDAIQLATGVNMRIMWSNIPLDSLVYALESPNYCDLDAVPHWTGMHGRRCLLSTKGDGSNDDDDESSCEKLCDDCGYSVRTRDIVTERSCNCKLTWNYQVQCERCTTVEEEFYCY